MKKIISAILVLLSLAVIAQPNATVTVLAVDKASVCPGDSIKIYAKMAAPTQTTQWTVVFSLWTTNYTNNIYDYHYSRFYKCPKQVVNGDTIYTVAMYIHHNTPMGPAVIKHSFYEIKVNLDCNPLSINELYFENEVLYFDLFGNQVEKKLGVLLIEQRGNTRRKIIINE